LKIGGEYPGFNISAKGLSIQRKKMNLIAENIANADSVRTENGLPYKRKQLQITQGKNNFPADLNTNNNTIRLKTSSEFHIDTSASVQTQMNEDRIKLNSGVTEDQSEGDLVYMPDHPNADEKGYVQMSNVNIITEMVDMIAASRSYEANLTALNSSKQMAKDSLEI
jgi:flagellar basal-body rod protein FlgC